MSVCRLLLLAFFNKEKAVSLLPALSLPFRLRASRIQAARALRTRFFLLFYVPPGHAPFGCSEDPPVPLARLLCCKGQQYGLNSKLPWGIFRGSFGGSTNGDRLSWFWVSCSVAHLVPGFLHRLSAQASSEGVIAPCFAIHTNHCRSEEEPPFLDGSFHVLAFHLLEGLSV